MSSRNVSYARFQTNMFLPGIGQVGDCLPSTTRTHEMVGLRMVETQYGLEVTLKGRTLVIPWPNVTGYELKAPDGPKTEAKPAQAEHKAPSATTTIPKAP